MGNAARKEKHEDVAAIEQKMKVLKEMRTAIESGVKDLAESIVRADAGQLSTMRLYPLLEAAAEAGSAEAVKAVVLAAGENVYGVFGRPEGELAERIVRAVGYHFEKSKVTLDEARKPTGLTRLIVECVKSNPKATGTQAILKSVIAAEADTSDFLNTVLRSDLDFPHKMKAFTLARKPDLQGDAIEIVEGSAVSYLTRADRHYHSQDSGKETVDALMKLYAGREDRLVEAVAAVAECEHLSALVSLHAESFELASRLVLEKGSPRALATFYRAHHARCDKKVFHAKLTDALKPDPEALAEAILDGGRGKYGMMHPMMMEMMMHGGPFGPPPGFFLGRRDRW